MIDGSINPLLLTRKQAKALVGVDPYAVCAPMRIGGRVYWHKPTLVEALSVMAAKAANNNTGEEPGVERLTGDDETVEGELERARKRITAGAASGRK